MSQDRKIRVLIAKPGLDGHEKGALLLSSRLKDAGMEVIYTGLRATVSMIVQTAVQEDVDVIGLSILSGAHRALVGKTVKMMKEEGIDGIPLLVGGVIPDEDVPVLTSMGVARVFTQRNGFDEIIDFIRNGVNRE